MPDRPRRPRVRAPLLAPFVLAPLLPHPPASGGPVPDKAGYTLWNPTPRELRRPLSADRPDATESPRTVDAGAIQLELSFAELVVERENGRTDTRLSIAPVNLKLGLSDSMDFQLLFEPIVRESVGGAPDATDTGDLGVRAKLNLWGNDEGPTALALLPYAVFPAGRRDEVAFGLIVPFGCELPGGWSFGAQAEIAFEREHGRYDASFSHTGVLSRGIAGDLGGFVEYIGRWTPDRDGRYVPAISTGLTYALGADRQLDLGVVVGLDHPRGEGLVVFAGITTRF